MTAQTRPTPISGLEMRVLVAELSRLEGSYVSGIHSLGENQVMRLKGPNGDADVVLSPTLGAWITSSPAHGTTTEFTTSLRQALLRLRLEDVDQLGLDRVISLRFSDGDRTVRLVVELMPPGNILLTDADRKVVAALREFKGTNRTISKGRPYVPPPQNRVSLDTVDGKSLEEVLSRDKTVGRALGRGLSIPRRYVDEILAKVSLSQDQSTPLKPESLDGIMGAIRDLLAATEHPSPSLVEGATGLELMVAPPVHGTIVETASSMSILMDRAFANSIVAAETEVPEDKETKEMEATVQKLLRQVEELGLSAVKLRRAAIAVRTSASKEEAHAILEHESLPRELLAKASDQSSTAAVSSFLFDRAKDSEAEVRRIEQVVGQLKNRLRRKKTVVPKSTVKRVIREKKEWFEKFRWFYTSEGRLAVGGRDAQSNTILVKKHMESDDVAYHADLFGSPFFILKGGKAQTNPEIRQVGQATAAFSSAWKTGLSAADVYWIAPEQVSSSAPSGEYLARGSFAIRGKKNFVTKNPVELALGLDGSGRLICGPEEAVTKNSSAYLVVIPNREKSSETGKKVLAELGRLYADNLGNIGLDDVMRALPTGGAKVVRKRDTRQSASPSGSA